MLERHASDQALLNLRLRCRPEMRIVQKLEPSDSGWLVENIQCVLGKGLEFTGRLDQVMFHVLTLCRGQQPLSAILVQAAARSGKGLDQIVPGDATVRSLIDQGFLWPVDEHVGRGSDPLPEESSRMSESALRARVRHGAGRHEAGRHPGPVHADGAPVPVPPSSLLPILHTLSDAVQNGVAEALESGGKRISCRSGCGACCRQLVPITEIEARRIAELIDSLPDPRGTEIRARFAAAVRRLDEAGLRERLEHPELVPQDEAGNHWAWPTSLWGLPAPSSRKSPVPFMPTGRWFAANSW